MDRDHAIFVAIVVALFALISVVESGTQTDYSFTPLTQTWQPDENFHVVVDCHSDAPETECANYCIHHGPLFKEMECAAFFVKNHTSCHMIPLALKDVTEAESAITYFKRS